MRKRMSHFLFLITFLLFSLSVVGWVGESLACTGIMLRNMDGSFVHGRTLEFGARVDSGLVVVPRGYEFTGKTPSGAGMKYKSKNACLGTYTFTDLVINDGINEKGLSVGAFYFPTYAGYSEINDENRSKALSPMDFPNWILTQFDTVEQVREAIKGGAAVIAPTLLDGWGPAPPPLHYIVYDRSGASLVIEPRDGKLKIFENPLGVFANSPDFQWHITNLRNYMSLSPENVPELDLLGLKLWQFGQGNGMTGLPGDFTPPSRFVRAAFFTAYAIPAPDPTLGIQQVFHILNNFDIPVGIAREKQGDVIFSDSTQATVARDPVNLLYYYRTFDDQTIRMADLKKFDPEAKVLKKLSTTGAQPVVDMSSEFK